MLGMLLVGVLMYALFQTLGQYYVDGVGYATIESILVGDTTAAWLLGLLFVCKALATSISLGSGSSGGIFSPSLFMGATLGGGFASLLATAGLHMPLSIPAFAMVGMGAMVGGGTGAVMTAVTMIFEMTRDYDIVMPLILAVAASVGVRRLLSQREHLHAETGPTRARHAQGAARQHVPGAPRARGDGSRRAGPARRDELRLASSRARGARPLSACRGDPAGPPLRRHPRQHRTVARPRRRTHAGDAWEMWPAATTPSCATTRSPSTSSNACGASTPFMAIVVKGRGVPHGDDVVGVITKEHVAEFGGEQHEDLSEQAMKRGNRERRVW